MVVAPDIPLVLVVLATSLVLGGIALAVTVVVALT